MTDVLLRKKTNRGIRFEWDVMKQTLTIIDALGHWIILPKPETVELIQFMHEVIYGKGVCDNKRKL